VHNEGQPKKRNSGLEIAIIDIHPGTHRAFIGPCIGDCSTTNLAQVQWTELSADYVGQQTYSNGGWPVAPLNNGKPWSDTVPDAPSGDYLIRDEVRVFLSFWYLADN
jgi:hypothetical protein